MTDQTKDTVALTGDQWQTVLDRLDRAGPPGPEIANGIRNELVGGPGEETVDHAAKRIGIESFDGAVPLAFAQFVQSRGGNVNGNIVWDYTAGPEDPNIFGHPSAVSREGRAILGRLAVSAMPPTA